MSRKRPLPRNQRPPSKPRRSWIGPCCRSPSPRRAQEWAQPSRRQHGRHHRKWHELAAWEASVSGPFDRWPTHRGFDKFYGFLDGETNQWAPFIYDGVHPVELPNDPSYHFLIEMTDHEIGRVIQAVEDTGELDNTLVFLIYGDNGTSA